MNSFSEKFEIDLEWFKNVVHADTISSFVDTQGNVYTHKDTKVDTAREKRFYHKKWSEQI